MLTSVILLASVLPTGECRVGVAEMRMVVGAASADESGKKRPRKRLPRPRSGIPSDEDDDSPESSKGTSGLSVLAPHILPAAVSLHARSGRLEPTRTPRHLLLQVLLI